MSIGDVRRQQLVDAYTNNPGEVVAYIDESHLVPNSGRPATVPPFYIVSAYVIPIADIDALRTDIRQLVRGEYWHTTQQHSSVEGQSLIHSFAEYVGDGDEPIIVSIKRAIDPADSDGEIARSACMTELLKVLSIGSKCLPVSLAVFEERKFVSQRNADERTIRLGRQSGKIPRTMHVLPSSPTHEKLLWLPDLVSFALYQSVSGLRQDYCGPFMARISIIELH